MSVLRDMSMKFSLSIFRRYFLYIRSTNWGDSSFPRLDLKFLDLSKSEMSLYVLDSPLNSSITLMSSSWYLDSPLKYESLISSEISTLIFLTLWGFIESWWSINKENCLPNLLHCHTFRQVARFINIGAFQQGCVIRN